MSPKPSTPKDLLKSQWIDNQGQILNWVEFAKERGWISETGKVKVYLPQALSDLGPFPTATAIYTDDKPLSPDGGHAILIDRQGKCWFRLARVEDDKVIITAWHWPHGEATVPSNHFETIERVSSTSFKRD